MEFTTNLWDALSSNPTLDNDLLNENSNILVRNHKMTEREFLLNIPHKNQNSTGLSPSVIAFSKAFVVSRDSMLGTLVRK